MAPSSPFPRRRVTRYLAGVALLVSTGGCTATAWQNYKESPANPMVWIRALVPPEGETFYSDRAQEIDHSLQRE